MSTDKSSITKEEIKHTNHVLPTVVPVVPAMPPRPRLVEPVVHDDVVPGVDVNPKIPVAVVLVTAVLAVSKQAIQATDVKPATLQRLLGQK